MGGAVWEEPDAKPHREHATTGGCTSIAEKHALRPWPRIFWSRSAAVVVVGGGVGELLRKQPAAALADSSSPAKGALNLGDRLAF